MPDSLTDLLHRASDGDLDAEERLYSLIAGELLTVARQERHKWRGNFTLDTVALISSAFMRVRSSAISWESRRHFFAVTRRAMRQALFTYAEAQGRQRRGGGAPHLNVDETFILTEPEAVAIIELREALEELRAADEVAVEIVELRYFVGLKNAEIGQLLEMGESTVGRKLRIARGFLRNAIGPEGEVLWGNRTV